MVRFTTLACVSVLTLLWGAGCAHQKTSTSGRTGDEIIVAGEMFHTGTRVVTWMDPNGYDAYRTERRFAPWEESSFEKTQPVAPEIRSPSRYGLRKEGLSEQELERVRGGGWDLATLQKRVDQFVIHYDVAGFSRNCFRILHDQRGLSVHFMLDLDGTIYQTLDLKERASHATIANSRSIGIEIANLGAHPPGTAPLLNEWYLRDKSGQTFIRVPERLGDPHFLTRNFVPRPAKPEPVAGMVQGVVLLQYDLTPQQYEALIKLTATLCRIFPNLPCDYPRDSRGVLLRRKLPAESYQDYRGILGHYHVQLNKTDPGPAFDWDRVIGRARALLGLPALPAGNPLR
jgi:N-acetyl-anhydromuramyl-L-alanine amidase AmpD